MVVSVITAIPRSVSGSIAGNQGKNIDVSARVSSNVNCLVAVVHINSPTVMAARWDVCGVNTTMVTAGEVTRLATHMKAFYLMNPAAGEHILRADVSGTAAATTRAICAYALAGVADSGSIGSFVAITQGFSAAWSLSAQVVSTANQVVIDGLYIQTTAAATSANVVLSAETNQIEVYDTLPAGAKGDAITKNTLAGSYQTGETSTRMSWQKTFGLGAAQVASHLAFNVVATAAGGGGGGTFRNSSLPQMGAGR